MVPVHLRHLPGAGGLCEKGRGAWPKGQSCPTPVGLPMDSPCAMRHRSLLWGQPRCSWDVQHFSFKSCVQLLVGPLCNWKVLGKTSGRKRSRGTFQHEQWHCYFLLQGEKQDWKPDKSGLSALSLLTTSALMMSPNILQQTTGLFSTLIAHSAWHNWPSPDCTIYLLL